MVTGWIGFAFNNKLNLFFFLPTWKHFNEKPTDQKHFVASEK